MQIASTNQKWKIEEMEIDKDHIHLLVESDPTIKPCDIVHKLKQYSTFYCWRKHRNHLKNFYWKKNAHFLWTRGYFISSEGNVSSKVVLNYIKNQIK